MDTELWRGFVSVADTGSYTAAAEALPISQSGLSQQIQRLERLLGIQLFVRTTRRVELTEAGAALLPRARAVLAAEDLALHEARRWSRSAAETTSLRLVVVENGVNDVLVRLVEGLRRTHPELRVEVQHIEIADQATALEELGDHDDRALVARGPLAGPPTPLERTVVLHEPLCLVVPGTADVPERISLDDARELSLQDQPWLPRHWLGAEDRTTVAAGGRAGGTGGDERASVASASFRNAVRAVGLDGRACLAPHSLATSYALDNTRVVELLDTPEVTVEVVSAPEGSPLLTVLHQVASELVPAVATL